MPVHKGKKSRLLRGLTIGLLLLCCLASLPSPAAAQRVLVGHYENAPKVFTDSSGRPAGIFVDILEHIAGAENWQLQYVPGTWMEGLDRLARGEIDLMPDVAYTPQRNTIFAFPQVPALSSWYQAYAPKGHGIKSIFDLNHKRILVLDRSVQQQAFARLSKGFGLETELIGVPDYHTMFAMVAKKEADAAVTNSFYGKMHADKFGLEDTAVIFEPSDLFYAAPPRNPKGLLAVLDRHLAAMKKDPNSLYYRSLKRWTSEKTEFALPAWLRIAGAGIVAFAVFSFLAGALFRRQVRLRTQELRQLNQEMEQRIHERTAELAREKERAEAADRLKSAFLAAMSHELRTPLNSIIGFTGILLQGLAGPLNGEQNKQLEMVRGSSRHLLALINDVLDISKIEAQQLQVFHEPFDLRASIEKVAASVGLPAEKKGLAFQVNIADEIGSWVSDQRRVEQILLNLLNNAIKFTEKGRVTLTAEIREGRLLRLAVSDTGIGIKEEDMQKLFQPFRQIDSGLARKHEGTGLGLAICRRLAELLGGEIHIHSVWEQGSTFEVLLPAKGDLAS